MSELAESAGNETLGTVAATPLMMRSRRPTVPPTCWMSSDKLSTDTAAGAVATMRDWPVVSVARARRRGSSLPRFGSSGAGGGDNPIWAVGVATAMTVSVRPTNRIRFARARMLGLLFPEASRDLNLALGH